MTPAPEHDGTRGQVAPEPVEAPTVEAVSPEVEAHPFSTRLPGASRGDYSRMPTGPVDVPTDPSGVPFDSRNTVPGSSDVPVEARGESTSPDDALSGPAGAHSLSDDLARQEEPAPFHRPLGVISGWALALSMVALTASWFGFWGLPLALVGVVLGGIALVRPFQNRALAWWSIGLGVPAVLFSLWWLVWVLDQLRIIDLF